MNPFELEDFIKSKAAQFENLDFIANDPISIVHRYKRKEDIEIIGLLIATIAWGNRKSIIKSGNKLSHILGESPYDFVLNFQEGTPLSFVHRTFNSKDLEFFLLGLKNIYNHGGLEYAFKNTSSNSGMIDRISNFRSMMLSVPHETRSEKHISNPLKNSACKRINMLKRVIKVVK